ncbi:hypothetical protein CTM46_02145 [Prevotella intermedia]|uniref:Uncharacterized protein n=1 Tax=Prevotella intermedia TaxID=28131 RepID=A0A2D3LIJ2_PREIN|nr:hypothetical protein CTM46_02145 [Prevotella intermedia]
MSHHLGNALYGNACTHTHRAERMSRHVENTYHLRIWKNIENKPITCCELVDFLYSASMIGKQFNTEY